MNAASISRLDCGALSALPPLSPRYSVEHGPIPPFRFSSFFPAPPIDFRWSVRLEVSICHQRARLAATSQRIRLLTSRIARLVCVKCEMLNSRQKIKEALRCAALFCTDVLPQHNHIVSHTTQLNRQIQVAPTITLFCHLFLMYFMANCSASLHFHLYDNYCISLSAAANESVCSECKLK